MPDYNKHAQSTETEFKTWLEHYLETEGSTQPCDGLLSNPAAIRFLIAWSCFEQQFFKGLMKADSIEQVSKESSNYELTKQASLNIIVSEFHRRYQDAKKLDRLFPKKPQDRKEPKGKSEFQLLIKEDFDSLVAEQKCQLLLWVIYRYRNNIFHGNKGVAGWLRYQEQIDMCTRAMLVWLTEKQRSSVSNVSNAQPVATQNTVVPGAGAEGKVTDGSAESANGTILLSPG